MKLHGDTSGSWLSRNSVACELFIKKKEKCLLIRKLDCFVTQKVEYRNTPVRVNEEFDAKFLLKRA